MQLFKYSAYFFLLLGVMSLCASEEEGFYDSPPKFLRGSNDPFLLQAEVEETLSLAVVGRENDSAFVSPTNLEDQEELFQDGELAIQDEAIDYEKYGLDKDLWLGASFPFEEKKKLLGALSCLQKADALLAAVRNDSEQSVLIRSKRKKSVEDPVNKKSASGKKNTQRSKKDKKS